MVRFPTEETNKRQDNTITSGEPYVEAQRKRLLVKIKLRELVDCVCNLLQILNLWMKI